MANGTRMRKSFYIVIVATTLTTMFLIENNARVHLGQGLSSSGNDALNWKDNLKSFLKRSWMRLTLGTPKLWPEQDGGDRILEQLAYSPPDLEEMTRNRTKFKTIFLKSSRLYVKATYPERRSFLEDNCRVDTCRITYEAKELESADAVIFTDVTIPKARTNASQIWVLYLLESPQHTPHFPGKVFNWTATYRPDSDVPNPYGKFLLYDPSVTSKPQNINYAANKTKKVAWFVTNCRTHNKRLQYAIELKKHIEVDIFGPCIPKNNLSCPRSKDFECNKMLKEDYKFYLSFENSNCHHYITEKFFYKALGNNVLPIVMGARKEDYVRAAPHHSFVHVDDFESPKALAEYLHKLDKNDTLYNEYFQWKGTGEFSVELNAHFWCRFCAMLHAETPNKTYDDMENWWRRNGTCTTDTWRRNSTSL